ncbi:MAG: chemotaxis protein CheC [Phycisphaerales bacterium]|nr:chemotaxis protein CheC [Phycisphaerales bacterium]
MEPMFMLELDAIDGIKEAANIGAGRAASELSRLTHKKCNISLPNIAILGAADIQEQFDVPGSVSVSLNVRILGDIPATMFVITKKECAQVMISYMTGVAAPATSQDISFTTQIALKQLGAELGRAFIQSLSEFLQIKTTYDVPLLLIEARPSECDATLKNVAKTGDRQLLVHCDFFDAGKTFKGKMIYMLGRESQGKFIERFKLLLSGEDPAPI